MDLPRRNRGVLLSRKVVSILLRRRFDRRRRRDRFLEEIRMPILTKPRVARRRWRLLSNRRNVW